MNPLGHLNCLKKFVNPTPSPHDAGAVPEHFLPPISIPSSSELKAELHLDWLKGVRGGVKRVLFLDNQQPQVTGLLTLGHGRPQACLSYTIYLKVSRPCYTRVRHLICFRSVLTVCWFLSLQEEDEFRDKLSPISLALNYSLAPPSHGQMLPPVLNYYSSTFLQEHVSMNTTAPEHKWACLSKENVILIQYLGS